jgi:hypothetical protein
MLRIAPTALTAGCLTALLFSACGGDGTSDLFGPGSKAGSGGLAASGASSGGSSSNTGGRATGGNPGGGRTASGGSDGGGSDGDGGGSDDGGSANGGTEAGGRSSGGRAATGGKASGGASTGGKATSGGSPNGGSGTGGVTTGGSNGATGGSKSTGGATACSETDGADVRVQGTSKGLNGSFTDQCENGSLIEYYCEKVDVIDPNCLLSASPNGGDADLAAPRPIPSCQVYTGQVVSTEVDCDGRCKDGTCNYWCPTVEHDVEYHEVGSDSAVLHNEALDFVYDCRVEWQRDGYDCSDPELVGSYVGVYSLGTCNLDNIVFGTDTPEEPGIQTCTFDCTLVD